MIRLLATRELRSLFALPSTWLLLGVLQFLLAWSFLARLDAWLQVQSQLAQLANPPGVTATIAAPLLGMLALLLMLLVPLFTMRAFAEERRNQTLVLLLSAPVTARQIVLGKFWGLFALFGGLILANLAMIASLSLGTRLDGGLLASNLLGLLLLTASFLSVGLLVSVWTTQPLVAAIGGLAALLGLWLVDVTASDDTPVWHQFSPLWHFQKFNNGLLDSADLAYFALLTVLCLGLTCDRLRRQS